MKQGEIYNVNFEPTVGNELQKDERPAVIISHDSINNGLHIYTVVPFRDTKEKHKDFKMYVVIEANNTNKLDKRSTADCTQIRAVDASRMGKKRGVLTKAEMDEIRKTIMFCIRERK